MGGHGLYSTVGDYLRFIRMWLDDGRADSGEQVLRPETVEFAARNHLGDLKIKGLPGVIPSLSNDAEFFPGMPKSWALTFMINDEDAPTGRPAGSLAWAGLANLYYWIDRQHRRSAGSGRRRSSRSPTRPRWAATWTSRPRPTAPCPADRPAAPGRIVDGGHRPVPTGVPMKSDEGVAAMAVSVNLEKALDKAWEGKSLDEILAAPPSALAGLTEKHDAALADALNIKTIADLGSNKYLKLAAALVMLGDQQG